MSRLVDSLLRGRAQPSARSEAAAAVSDVRAFVRAWRPAVGPGASELKAAAAAAPAARASRARDDAEERSADGAERREQGGEAGRSTNSVAGGPGADRPSPDVLLELAQVRGVRGPATLELCGSDAASRSFTRSSKRPIVVV